MPLDKPTLILLSALAVHAFLFWDAPRQLARAKREAAVTRARTYHVANLGLLVLLLAAAVSEIVWRTRPGFHPAGGSWDAGSRAALTLGLAGLALAAWAKLTLGPWFAPTAAKFPGQRLIRSGPYRWLHHPMYVGWWFFLVSIAWTMNSVVLAVTAALTAPLLMLLGRHERSFLSGNP